MNKLDSRLRYRGQAQAKLEEILRDEKRVLIVHYSSESFYDIKDGKTPRVTSIAVRFMKSAQTKSFSIHKEAERIHIPFNEIDSRYDELEKLMLTDFFEFVSKHSDYTWVHWNMRDENYGFPALESRFKVLGGEPYEIQDDNKADLARILIDKYSPKLAGHPRLQKLMEMNGMTPKDMLSGAEEALAFTNKGYIKLHQSTLRKVDIFDSLLRRAEGGELRTAAKAASIYGLSIQGVIQFLQTKWWWSVILFIVGAGIGGIIENKAGNIFDSFFSTKQTSIKK